MLRNTHTHTCIQYMLNHIRYTHTYTYAYLYGMYQQGNVSEWEKFVMNSLACLRNKFFSFFLVSFYCLHERKYFKPGVTKFFLFGCALHN